MKPPLLVRFRSRDDRRLALDVIPAGEEHLRVRDRLSFRIDDRAVDRFFIGRDRREREAQRHEQGCHRRFLRSGEGRIRVNLRH